MGLHLGEAEERGGDYFGATVSTAARIAAAGHGGQVLMTDQVRATSRVDAVDLGVHYLRDVDEPLRLFQLGEGRFPPLRVVDPAMTNLPVRPTRLIGRDEDVARIRKLLAEHRLVTVTAVGGSGKTRVAIAAGEAELPHRSGGVWFADLAAVTTRHRGPGGDQQGRRPVVARRRSDRSSRRTPGRQARLGDPRQLRACDRRVRTVRRPIRDDSGRLRTAGDESGGARVEGEFTHAPRSLGR